MVVSSRPNAGKAAAPEAARPRSKRTAFRRKKAATIRCRSTEETSPLPAEGLRKASLFWGKTSEMPGSHKLTQSTIPPLNHPKSNKKDTKLTHTTSPHHFLCLQALHELGQALMFVAATLQQGHRLQLFIFRINSLDGLKSQNLWGSFLSDDEPLRINVFRGSLKILMDLTHTQSLIYPQKSLVFQLYTVVDERSLFNNG